VAAMSNVDLIARAAKYVTERGEHGCNSDCHTCGLIRDLANCLAAADKINAALREALKQLLDGYLAHWMAARAEIEGAHMSNHLFDKEFDVIAARAALALASGEQS
jgi:hypothetical protein